MAGWLKNGLVGLVTAATLGLSGPVMAQETNPKGYDVPSTDPTKAEYLGQKTKVVDGVECVLKGYRVKSTGQRFNTAEVKSTNKIFAYTMFQKNGTKPGYVDKNCDGKFETKYEPREEWQIPSCAQNN